MADTHQNSRRSNLLLALGAAAGILLAASGLLEPSSPQLPKNIVANINGSLISKEEYLGYLELLARDKRNPMTAEDERHVLNRLIEEKLLLQRGLDIGLPESSPPVRKVIVQQMMQSIVADVSTESASQQDLQDFYQENINYFAHPARLHLQKLVFKGDDSLPRAKQARSALLNGLSWQEVAAQYADRDILPIPNEPLPQHKLLQYIGPSLTEKVASLSAGTLTEPLADNNNYMLILVIEQSPRKARPYADVEELVTSEYERRRGDQALRDYLDELTDQADISIDEDFLRKLSQRGNDE